MIIYCDTSLIVPTLVPERFSEAAEDWLKRRDLALLAFSGWSDAEVASALAQKERSGAIGADRRAQAATIWVTMSAAMRRVPIEPFDFADSALLVDAGSRGLRAGDALHLAIVRRAGLGLATLDRDLADAAEASGVAVALRPPS